MQECHCVAGKITFTAAELAYQKRIWLALVFPKRAQLSTYCRTEKGVHCWASCKIRIRAGSGFFARPHVVATVAVKSLIHECPERNSARFCRAGINAFLNGASHDSTSVVFHLKVGLDLGRFSWQYS
jgi:hypothetical protein